MSRQLSVRSSLKRKQQQQPSSRRKMVARNSYKVNLQREEKAMEKQQMNQAIRNFLAQRQAFQEKHGSEIKKFLEGKNGIEIEGFRVIRRGEDLGNAFAFPNFLVNYGDGKIIPMQNPLFNEFAKKIDPNNPEKLLEYPKFFVKPADTLIPIPVRIMDLTKDFFVVFNDKGPNEGAKGPNEGASSAMSFGHFFIVPKENIPHVYTLESNHVALLEAIEKAGKEFFASKYKKLISFDVAKAFKILKGKIPEVKEFGFKNPEKFEKFIRSIRKLTEKQAENDRKNVDFMWKLLEESDEVDWAEIIAAIERGELKILLHYDPSIMRLHIHFVFSEFVTTNYENLIHEMWNLDLVIKSLKRLPN